MLRSYHFPLKPDQAEQAAKLAEKLKAEFAGWSFAEARLGASEGSKMGEYDSAPIFLARREPAKDRLEPSAIVVLGREKAALLGLLNARMDRPFFKTFAYGALAVGFYAAPVVAVVAAGAAAGGFYAWARKRPKSEALPLAVGDADPARPAARLALHLLSRHPGEIREPGYWEGKGHTREPGVETQAWPRQRWQRRAIRAGILATGGAVALAAAPAGAGLLSLAAAGIALGYGARLTLGMRLWKKFDEADDNVAAEVYRQLVGKSKAPAPTPRVYPPAP